ncbi:MAG: hypothetical protein HZC28_16990 [Spirochaetes bacterium]|nr:hypothetical protein [Spirochaetota bacterium]
MLLFCFSAYSDYQEVPAAVYPVLPSRAADAKGFIPKGWVIEEQQQGDLNKDGKPDLLILLRQNNPSNIVTNDGMSPGTPSLDSNPRILAIAFQQKKNVYTLAVQNHDLIPRHDNPCIDDPLGGVSIDAGNLIVRLHFWANAGSWSTSSIKFTFRYQAACFKLIGYDDSTSWRNTGETIDVSINYLTKKAKCVLGNYTNNLHTEKWADYPDALGPCLDAIGDGSGFSPEPRSKSFWGIGEKE